MQRLSNDIALKRARPDFAELKCIPGSAYFFVFCGRGLCSKWEGVTAPTSFYTWQLLRNENCFRATAERTTACLQTTHIRGVPE